MNDSKNIAIWIGALASVALVVLYFVTQGNQSSDGSVKPVFTVSGITPEVAAIRSGERIAKIEANKETALGWFSYLLGKTGSDNETTVSLAQTNATRDIAKIEADSNLGIANLASTSAERVASSAALSEVQRAQIEADAAKYAANQQAKAAGKGKTLGGIASIVGAVASFF